MIVPCSQMRSGALVSPDWAGKYHVKRLLSVVALTW